MPARTTGLGRRPQRERGSATAEIAVALPALVVVMTLLLWVVAAVGAQMRCTDAARIGARAVARGEPRAAAVAAARRAAPSGASVTVRVSGGLVRVTVEAELTPEVGSVGALPHWQVRARAATPQEPR